MFNHLLTVSFHAVFLQILFVWSFNVSEETLSKQQGNNIQSYSTEIEAFIGQNQTPIEYNTTSYKIPDFLNHKEILKYREKYFFKIQKYRDSGESNDNNKKLDSTHEPLSEDYEDEDKDLLHEIFEEKRRQDAFNVTSPKASPYSVLIVAQRKESTVAICTGSLVTAEWVLTAAHCVQFKEKIDSVVVYAGGNSFEEVLKQKPAVGSQFRKSINFYPHPKYTVDSESGDYDVGVIKVDKKFDLTDTVNVINITTTPWAYHSYYNCVFTGFGRVQLDRENVEDEMRKTHFLDVKKPCLCSFRLSMLLGSKQVRRYICSKPVEDYGVCDGDSGGGLVCDGQVKGVASQILQMTNMKSCSTIVYMEPLKCGSDNTLSIFEDVCPFLRWINSHVQMFKDDQIHKDCVDKGGFSKLGSPTTLIFCILCTPLKIYYFV